MSGPRPPMNLGMTSLDKSKFTTELPLLMATINPKFIGKLGKEAKQGELLDLRAVSRVIHPKSGTNERAILFDQSIKSQDQLSVSTLDLLKEAEAEYGSYSLALNYDHWTAEEILRSILPEELGDVPTGFTIVGHIAHLNLRDQFLPFKHIIGQVVLDKNTAIRTVVNKLDSIHAVYRTFDMEVIAGESDNFWVEQHESNCRFQFDFSKVYWNSRLHSEHERLVSLFNSGEAVCDPFAGVGPFAVPAGKKNVLVFANDLNPNSYEAMKHNIELNKVGQFVYANNEDGRVFIQKSAKRLLEFRSSTSTITPPSKKPSRSKPAQRPEDIIVPEYFSHYVMNLPDSAIEFLDGFRGLYDGVPGAENYPLPMVHVHCFFKHPPTEKEPPMEEVQASLAERISKSLGYTMDPKLMTYHDVRKVAPTKEMYCVSFKLPKEVAFASS